MPSRQLVPRERFASHVVAPRITADVLDDNGGAKHRAAVAMTLRRRQVIGGLHLQPHAGDPRAPPGTAAARPSVLFSCQRLNVTVGGCAAFYSAVLSCAPERPVTIAPGSLPTCLRVTPSLQIFTAENWMTPQFFRVAALSSATYDDVSSSSSSASKDERRRFLQIIEHYSSSSDARFNGNRLLYLPATLVVHVSPRDGTSVMASGRVLGTAQPLQPITKQIATDARNDFEPLAPEHLQAGARGLVLHATATASSSSSSGSGGPPQPGALVAKSSAMCAPHVAPGTTATASAAAVAAVEAANTATQHALSKRLQSRRNLLAAALSTSSDGNGGGGGGGGSGGGDTSTSLATELLEGLYHSLAKDSQAFLKVVCRKNQTVLLHRNKQLVVLGKRDGIAAAPAVVDTAASSARSSPRQRGHGTPPYSARARPPTTAAMGDDNDDDSAADAALCNMVTDVDCGDDHIVAITEQGYLLTWGDGRMGQLGHGLRRSRRTPRLVQSLLHKRIVQVACGARHTFALAEDGDVYSWGYSKGGALGHSTSTAAGPERDDENDDDDGGGGGGGDSSSGVADVVASPLEVLTLKHRGVARIACGDMHTAVVLTNGMLLTCGWADQGRLGRPCGSGSSTSEYSSCFARVDLKHRLCTFVACGGAHTLVLTDCKSLLAFGSNASGQLGVGDLRCRTAPTLVAYFDASHATLTGVAAGQRHSFAMTQDARLFAWGSDEFGQCGLGSFPQIYTVPHLVSSAVGLGVVQVAGGDAHSVALCQATPRHLDAMEANHPTRYAALVERFEAFVREDASRRAKVLAVAKQRQLAMEEATRKRKPPLDPTLLRGPAWQAKLEAARAAAAELVETSAPVALASAVGSGGGGAGRGGARPQTASMVRVPTSASPTKTQRPATANGEKRKVRCSSATLWRQRQLFTFTPPPPPPAETATTEAPSSSVSSPTTKRATRASSARPYKPDASSVTVQRLGTNQAPDGTSKARPASAAVAHPLRLTPEARQELGRILDGEDESARGRERKPPSIVSTNAPLKDEKQEPHDGASSAVTAAARFPASRPKSAPSRAAATTKCQK